MNARAINTCRRQVAGPNSTLGRRTACGAVRAARPGRRQSQFTALLTTIPNVSQRSGRHDTHSTAAGKLRVIGLISALADVQAQVQQFEVFAGRSAMIGFIVALSAELLTERSIFRSVDVSEAALASGVLLAAITVAAVAAAASSRKHQFGLEIREAVITSLTAVRRSAASVTGKQVDRAVDHILNKVFDMGVIYSLLADEDIM